jgi:hypothetical protein
MLLHLKLHPMLLLLFLLLILFLALLAVMFATATAANPDGGNEFRKDGTATDLRRGIEELELIKLASIAVVAVAIDVAITSSIALVFGLVGVARMVISSILLVGVEPSAASFVIIPKHCGFFEECLVGRKDGVDALHGDSVDLCGFVGLFVYSMFRSSSSVLS